MRKFQFPAIFFSVLTIFLAGFFVNPGKAAAACDVTSNGLKIGDCLILNNTTGDTVSSVYDTPAKLINVVVYNIFFVAGFILLAMIIYSGFLFISQGPKGAEQAKNVITTALIGFTIMFSAFWILQIIKAITGADIIF